VPRFCPSGADGERIALGRRVVAPSTDAQRNVHALAEQRIDARLGSRVDLLAQRGFCANYVSDVLGTGRTAAHRHAIARIRRDRLRSRPTVTPHERRARSGRPDNNNETQESSDGLAGEPWRRHRRREARSLSPPDRRPVRRIFTGAA